VHSIYRAVAAGPVSPVSTGPLFPHSWLALCLALPISDVAWQTPTQHPKAHRYHVESCEIAANSATELFRESSKNFPQTISLASFTCEGSGFRPISKLDRKADTIGVRRNGQNGIQVKLCRLASEKHRIGPKLVSEAISQPLNFMPPDPPSRV